MKLDRSLLDNENFKITEHKIAGELCTFVRPQGVGAFNVWNNHNLMYRSSIWNYSGDLISAGYPKFFNLEEKPHITPFNGNLYGCSIIEKIDGSCLIVSKYRGQFIFRTRGSIDAREMPNGHEIDYLVQKYDTFFNKLRNGPDSIKESYIFEWVTPQNKIVIGYTEPDLYLTNIIDHENYTLRDQESLDIFAQMNGFKRPARYYFNSLSEMLNSISSWCGQEGCCLYYDNDQHIRKVKSSWYLKLHAFKSNCNQKTLLSLWFEWDKPTIEEFKRKIESVFDYECVKMSEPTINCLFEKAIIPTVKVINEITEYVNQFKDIDQKTFAQNLMTKFGKSEASVGFAIRKNSKANKAIRNLIESKFEFKIESKYESDF